MDAVVEFWKELPDYLQWGLLPWLVATAFISFSLKNPGEGRDRFLKIIKKQALQSYYHNKLKGLLNDTAKHFFKDHELLKARRKNRSNNTYSNAGFFNTYTESSYVFLLWLALVYPLLFVMTTWFITSHGGEIGDFKILNDGVSFFQRLTWVAGFSVFILFFWKAVRTSGVKMLIYFAVAVAGAVAFAGAAVGVGAVAVAFAFAGAIAVAGAGAVAVVAVTADYLYDKAKGKSSYLLIYWLFFLVFFVLYLLGIIYYLGTQAGIKTESLSTLIFLGLLPLVNSPFDWASLGVTRSLLYSIVDRVHGGGLAVFWSLFDIVIALALLLGIISASTLMISVANYLFQQGGHYGPILDLNIVFNDLRIDPYNSRYAWMYLIFLSTLIPTFVHLILAAWAVVMWVPAKAHKQLHKKWEENQLQYDFPKFTAVTLYFSVFLPLAVIAPALVLYGLHLVLIQYGYVFIMGESLLDSMEILAHWVNPLMANH